MIGIRHDGQFFAMPPKAKVALEFNNPLFDDNIIQGDYSLPLDLPYRGNGKKFGFNYDLLVKSRVRSFPNIDLVYKMLKLYPGILDVNIIAQETVSTSLRLNISSLTVMNKKLSELSLGTYFIGSDQDAVLAYANGKTNQTYPTAVFNFPMIYNEKFYDGKNPDYENFMNNYENGVGFYKNILTNRNTLVPMAYLMHVLACGFDYDGYTLDMLTGFPADAVQKKLLIYNNYAIDRTHSSTSSGGLRASCSDNFHYDQSGQQDIIFDDETTGGNYDALNAYDESTGNYTIQAAGVHAVHVRSKFGFIYGTPPVSDTIIIRLKKNGVTIHTETRQTYTQVWSDISFTHTFTATGGDVGQDLHVTVEYYNDFNPDGEIFIRSDSNVFAVNDFSTSSDINVYKDTIELSEHMPDITFGQLLNAIKKVFNLDINFNHRLKTVRINYFDSLIVNGYKEFTRKAVPGHRVLLNSDTYKLFNFTWNGDDELTNDNFKFYNDALYIGSFPSLLDLNTDVPAGASVVGKFAHTKEFNIIWKCNDLGSSTYKWEYYTDAWYDEVVNPDGTIEIKPECSTLLMRKVDLSPALNDHIILPQIKQVGSSDEFELGKNPTSLRLIHYHGVYGDNGNDTPFSSSTNYDITGVQLYTKSMLWKTGLLPFWENRIFYYLRGDWIEKKIKYNIIDLLNYQHGDRLRFESGDFLIKQMRVEVGDEIDEAVLTLLRI